MTTIGAKPRRVRQGISAQQIGIETLLYDERQHRAFCLNESSGVIWRLADGERTVEQMREEAKAELGAAISEELVRYALDELRQDRLLEMEQQEAATISRRELVQRLGVAGALLLPAITSIVAPTPAQAYSGCFDCSDSDSNSQSAARAARIRRAQQLNNSRSAPAPASSPDKQ